MSLNELKQSAIEQARHCCGREDTPQVVVAPYRFNPLGAHVDHQGGPVLSRTLDQYTILVFWPNHESNAISLSTDFKGAITTTDFPVGFIDNKTDNWVRYAQAAATALSQHSKIDNGFTGFVSGTLVGAGLSSSASVVLAYLYSLAACNDITLTEELAIELARQVENDHLGLNNGIQDQMSIVFGKSTAMAKLNMDEVSVTYVNDPPTAANVSWVICYSGFDRELVGSSFNTRVAECQQAASQLDANAKRLGDLNREPFDANLDNALESLPLPLAGRARHFFTETNRVELGVQAWAKGDWVVFGDLMNASCNSSINHYECGSQPLIDLHEIAKQTDGVYGSRFGGGGYGGCLIMLVQTDKAQQIADAVLNEYSSRYPKQTAARSFVATIENGVRLT